MPTTVKNCPGAEVATLTGTVAENNRTYTAPANTVLKPNTTYWVVVNDGVTDNRVGWYTTFDHNETSTDGWTIGNTTIWRNYTETSYTVSDGRVAQMSVGRSATQCQCDAGRVPG